MKRAATRAAALLFLVVGGVLVPHPGSREASPPLAGSDLGIGAEDAVRSSAFADLFASPPEEEGTAFAIPDRAGPAPLQSDVLRMIGSTGWRSADWGVLAISLTTGDRLVELNADLPLAPASNVKLFTSAAALERLGPDFRFPTYLVARGPIEDGVLRGDLILFGTGDPTLGLRDPQRPVGALATFLEALQAQGIREIQGDIVGDGSHFSGDPRRPSWNPSDLNDWFAAPVSALSFNQNVVTLRVTPGVRAGSAPRILTLPAGAGIPVANLGRTVAVRPQPNLLMVRDDPDDPVEIRGEIHVNGGDVWRSLTVSDPPAYAASVFRETLRHAGIQVLGGVRSVAAGDPEAISETSRSAPAIPGAGGRADLTARPPARTLAVHHSAPLPDLLATVNKESHNLYAELLLFTLGRTTDGDGTFPGGARALSTYLTASVGVPGEALHVEDGSGLSRLNRATPAALVATLAHMDRSPQAEHFWNSLPEAGNRRELNRMHQSGAAGNLRAKTGTIHRTSALSGIVRTASGEPVFFSILANDVPSPGAAKRVEDRIGIALAGFYGRVPGPELSPPGPFPGTGGESTGTVRRDR